MAMPIQPCAKLGPRHGRGPGLPFLSESLHYPAERRMAPVLDLDPTIEPAAAVGAVTVLTDQPFEAELAGMTEQIRPDLALLERRDVDAVQVWPAFWRLGT
jgi:hypothetical protein